MMNAQAANEVWDILVEHAGANESQRPDFVYHAQQHHDWGLEYRFQGTLGFGGKIHVEARDIRVTCYREDETPERKLIVENVNKVLKAYQSRSLG